jgi:hypothetical protein
MLASKFVLQTGTVRLSDAEKVHRLGQMASRDQNSAST